MAKQRKPRNSPEQGQAKFLAAYQRSGNIVRAARIAGIQRKQHYRWLDSDPEYSRRFDESRREAADILESEAMRRAVDGTQEPVLYNGKPVKHPETGENLYRHKYSDTLLIFLLKGLMPEKYRDSFVPTGDDDGVRIAGRDREEIIREEIEARQRALDMLTRHRQDGN